MDKKRDAEITERRRFVRLNVAVDVQYTVLDKESPESIKIASRNISAGGICLIAYEELTPGTLLALTIYFPDSSFPVICKGRAVWLKSFKVATEEKERFDVGVEFVEIDEKDKNKINQSVISYK